MALSVTNLVGFGSKRAAAGGGGDTFTYVDETTSTGYSVSFAAGAAAGDVALVCEFFDSSTALAGSPGTVPSGWAPFNDTILSTVDFQGGAKDCHMAIYRKVLTSGDISTGSVSSAVTGNADTAAGMACQIWRPSSTPTFSDQEVDIDSWAPAPVSVTSSSGTPITIVVGASSGANSDGMGSESPAFSQYTSVAGALEFGVTVYTASPSDQTLNRTTPSGDSGNMVAYANLSFA